MEAVLRPNPLRRMLGCSAGQYGLGQVHPQGQEQNHTPVSTGGEHMQTHTHTHTLIKLV